MSWLNLQKLGVDYGPIAFVVLAVIFLLWCIFKVYPAIASFVAVMNLLKSIPERFNKVDASNERNDASLSDLKTTVEKQGTAALSTAEALAKHIEWGNGENAFMHKYAEASERQQNEWELIRDAWYDVQAKVNILVRTVNKMDETQDSVAYEVRHNGGGSMKDSTVRGEKSSLQNGERLERIEASMERLTNRLDVEQGREDDEDTAVDA